MKKIILLLFLIANTSRADVCELLSKDQAEKALSALNSGALIDVDNHKMIVRTVSVSRAIGTDFFSLEVNGKTLDLGYVYVILNKNVYLSIGKLIGCDDPASVDHIIRPTKFKSE